MSCVTLPPACIGCLRKPFDHIWAAVLVQGARVCGHAGVFAGMYANMYICASAYASINENIHMYTYICASGPFMCLHKKSRMRE